MLQSIDRGLDWNSIKAINGNTELINVIKGFLEEITSILEPMILLLI